MKKLLTLLSLFFLTLSCSSRKALLQKKIRVPKGYIIKETENGIYFMKKRYAHLPMEDLISRKINLKKADLSKKREKRPHYIVTGKKRIKTKITKKHDAVLVD